MTNCPNPSFQSAKTTRPDRAAVQHAAADLVAPVPAERTSRPLTGDSVRRDPDGALEAPDGSPGLRAEHAVHRSAVDPFRAQGRLEGRDARAPLTPGRPC